MTEFFIIRQSILLAAVLKLICLKVKNVGHCQCQGSKNIQNFCFCWKEILAASEWWLWFVLSRLLSTFGANYWKNFSKDWKGEPMQYRNIDKYHFLSNINSQISEQLNWSFRKLPTILAYSEGENYLKRLEMFFVTKNFKGWGNHEIK